MSIQYFLIIFLVILISALAVSMALVPLIIRLAYALGALDKPGLRKIHTHSKPRLGGVAFFLSFWVILTFCWGLGTMVNWTDEANHRLLIGMLSGSLILFLVGLYDDLRSSGPYLKLIAQIIAALVVISTGTRINLFIPNALIGNVLTLVWIIGITNSFNLLDNMDGLSAGLGCICSLMMLIIGLQQGSVLHVIISVTMIGALLGFLKFNFYPSKIFMGDSGSYFIGFILSVLSVETTYISQQHFNPLPLITPLLVFAVPLFDTLSVIYIRIRENRSIFRGDMSHFSHRLTALGMTQKQAVLFIYLVSFIIGISATFLPEVSISRAVILLCQSCAIFVIIIVLMRAARNVMEKNLERDFDDFSEYY